MCITPHNAFVLVHPVQYDVLVHLSETQVCVMDTVMALDTRNMDWSDIGAADEHLYIVFKRSTFGMVHPRIDCQLSLTFIFSLKYVS